MDFNFKRPADPPTEPAPKKFKATEQPATVPTTVDLNYPFWYTNADNGGGGGGGGGTDPPLNPPFVDPNGPLVNNDGLLNIRLQKPIAAVGGPGSKSVTLLTDNSLGLDESYKLGLKLAPGSGILAEQDGLKLDVDHGSGLVVGAEGLGIAFDDLSLEIDPEFKLAVKLDTNGPLTQSSAGITLVTDSTLTIDPSTQDPQQAELGVRLSTQGPINAGNDGLDLDYDAQSLELQTPAGESHLELAVKLDPTTMRKTASGISVNTSIIPHPSDSGPLILSGQNELSLAIDESTLSVNAEKQLTVKGGGGASITASPPLQLSGSVLSLLIDQESILGRGSSGLTALINNSDFTNHPEKGLSLLTPITYLSPFCIMTSGDTNMSATMSTVISASGSVKWKCGYYLQMVNSSGIVHGSLNILLDRTRMSDNPPNTYNNLEFAFAVGFDENDHDVQYCPLSNTTYVPTSAAPFFVPKTLGNSLHDLSIPAQALNWYISYNTSGSLSKFKPSTNPPASAYFTDAIMNFSVRRVENTRQPSVLFFSFFIPLPSSFISYSSVATTPISFTYLAVDKPSFLGLGSQ